MILSRCVKVFALVAFMCAFAGLRCAGNEILDNSKLLEAIKGGLSPKVVMASIEDAKDCQFTATVKDKIAFQSACKEARWTEPDIDALQLKVNKLAQQTVKDMKQLVGLFLTAAENVGESEEDKQYEELLHRLALAGPSIVPPLIDNLSQESDRKRKGIIEALVRIGEKTPLVIKACRDRLDDTSPPVRAQAAKAVAALSGPETGAELLELFKRRDSKNDAVALALGYMHYEKAIEPLVSLLKNSRDSDERVCAAFALGDLRAKTFGAPDALLEAVLDEKDEKLRYTAAKAAALIGDRRTPLYVMKAFDRFRQGRPEILGVLVYFKSIPAARFVADLLESNDNDQIRKAAAKTLELMTNEHYESREQWIGFIDLLQVRPEWQEPKDTTKLPEPLEK
jgi:HEAT repeat protein